MTVTAQLNRLHRERNAFVRLINLLYSPAKELDAIGATPDSLEQLREDLKTRVNQINYKINAYNSVRKYETVPEV